jgi:hypothetical protein
MELKHTLFVTAGTTRIRDYVGDWQVKRALERAKK